MHCIEHNSLYILISQTLMLFAHSGLHYGNYTNFYARFTHPCGQEGIECNVLYISGQCTHTLELSVFVFHAIVTSFDTAKISHFDGW